MMITGFTSEIHFKKFKPWLPNCSLLVAMEGRKNALKVSVQELRKLCLAIMLEMTAQKRFSGSLPVIFCEFVTNNKHSSELCSDAVDSGAIPIFCSLLLEALQRLPSTSHRVLPKETYNERLTAHQLLLQRISFPNHCE